MIDIFAWIVPLILVPSGIAIFSCGVRLKAVLFL